MKNKISKILGVGLTIAVLTSLLVVGAPASAGTLEWTTESLPTAPTSYQTGVTRGILDYAVGSDNGSTIYAVTGTPHLYKSTNGGSSWNRLTLTNLPPMYQVEIAPDNNNIVAVGTREDVVSALTVTAPGGNFTGRPTVTIAAPGGTGLTASATALLTGTSVNNVIMTAGGSGYTTAPAVVFTNQTYDTTGSGAAGTSIIAGGAVTGVTITSGGTLYNGAPAITFVGGGGTGAKATANLTATTIASFEPTSIFGGTGYAAAPAVTITGGGGAGATATAALTGAPRIYVSTNGAATGESDSWNDAGAVTTAGLTALTALRDMQVSPVVSGVRHIAAAGTKTGGLPGVLTLNLGGTIADWTDATGFTGGALLGGSNSVFAVAFSPNWLADRVLVAVSSNSTDFKTYLNVARFLTPTTGAWNASTDFTEYTGAGTSNGLISTGTQALQTADIALAPTYLGADSSSRFGYVALDYGADTGSGVYRMEDAKRKLMEMTDARFTSVAYKGADLIAGRADINSISKTSNPTATTPTVTDITDQYQRPAGGRNAVANSTKIAFAGANIVAATYGNESAFSKSTDGGATFNDISFIQNSITNVADIAVSPDGSKWFMVSNDGADTSVWCKTGTTWERLMSIVGNNGPFVIRMAPDNANVLYVVNTGTTSLYYTDDGGQKKWTPRISNENITDLAVESAQVIYYASGLNIRKSTNAGFLWNDPSVAAFTSGAAYKISSVGNNRLLVTNDSGVVSYSTDGGATFTRPATLTGAGNVKAASDNLTNKTYIYAAGDEFTDAADNVIYRYEVGSVAPDNVWKKIGATTMTGVTATADFTGIALVKGALYATTYDAANGTGYLYRSINPTAADTTVTWSAFAGTPDITAPAFAANPDGGRNSNLNISTSTAGNKVWAIDQDFVIGEETGDSSVSTNDEIYSFTDTIATSGPTLSGPADASVIGINPVSGNPYAITLSWARPSLATAYQYDLALDNKFASIVTSAAVNPVDPAITPVTITVAPALINPGTTYYWRVKVTAPVESPWSAARSFTIGSLDAPFGLKEPVVGAQNVPIKPILTWAAYKGALWYEVTVSEDPTFAIPEWSHNVYQLFYGVEEPLKYGTTYYWRVRGVTAEPYVKGTKVITPAGPWSTGAFTTMVEPVAPKPEQVIVTQQAPAPPPQIIQVPVEKIVQQPIPNWMLMTIIVIGAILIIALIVLIVRTRRVA